MNLILIKHSHPEIRPEAPASTWTLSEKGRQRCTLLANSLRAYAPRQIVTSEEPKARETGEIVAAALNLPVATAADLHEHDRSNTTYEASQAQFEAQVEAFFKHPAERVYGLESANEALLRFERALNMVMDQYPVETLAVVAHGTVISLMVAHLTRIDPLPLWRTLTLPSYVVVDTDSKKMTDCILFPG